MVSSSKLTLTSCVQRYRQPKPLSVKEPVPTSPTTSTLDEVELSAVERQSPIDTQTAAVTATAMGLGGFLSAPFCLVMMGKPGCGKGTHGKMLAQWLDVPHVSMGQLLREEKESGGPLASQIRGPQDRGDLVPSPVVAKVLSNWKAKNPQVDQLILDGFPRMPDQVADFEKLGFDGAQFLNMEITDGESRRRLTSRGRKGETPKVIENRIEQFHKDTQPVIDELDDRGLVLHVDGYGSPEETGARIRRTLAERLS